MTEHAEDEPVGWQCNLSHLNYVNLLILHSNMEKNLLLLSLFSNDSKSAPVLTSHRKRAVCLTLKFVLL